MRLMLPVIASLVLLAGAASAQEAPTAAPGREMPPVMTPKNEVVLRPLRLRQQLENPRRQCEEDDCLSPVEAVTYAAYLAPRAAVASTFKVRVKAVGNEDKSWFLNSEEDYRDRNCLTIRLAPLVADLIRRAYDNQSLEDIFKGRTIQVGGVARRVRIDFLAEGKPTGKYYYQTHVNVDSVAQLGFLDAGDE